MMLWKSARRLAVSVGVQGVMELALALLVGLLRQQANASLRCAMPSSSLSRCCTRGCFSSSEATRAIYSLQTTENSHAQFERDRLRVQWFVGKSVGVCVCKKRDQIKSTAPKWLSLVCSPSVTSVNNPY